VERMCHWIVERRAAGHRVGIVTPVVLNFHEVAPLAMDREDVRAAKAGTLESPVSLDRIRAALPEPESESSSHAFFHAGIDDWDANYIRRVNPRAWQLRSLWRCAAGLEREARTSAELRHDPAIRRAATEPRSEVVRIDSAPGGACAYHADLIREIGPMDESFSPFGYEDADFAIRALRAGYENYLLPTELALHDLDARKRDRDASTLVFTEARARALIARKHADPTRVRRILVETAALGALHAMQLFSYEMEIPPDHTGVAAGSTLCFFAGFLDGLFTPLAGIPDGPSRCQSAIPHEVDAHADRIPFRLWDGSPLSGLPAEVLLHAALSYSWNRDSGCFDLRNLEIDAPGLAVLRMSASVTGIGSRADDGRPEPLDTTLSAFHAEFHDHGLLSRLETSVAWRRRERSSGYLAALLDEPATEEGERIRWFLSLRRRPATLTIDLAPQPEISVRELIDSRFDPALRRRVGLSVSVTDGS